MIIVCLVLCTCILSYASSPEMLQVPKPQVQVQVPDPQVQVQVQVLRSQVQVQVL